MTTEEAIDDMRKAINTLLDDRNNLLKKIERLKAKAEGNEIIAIERGKAIEELQNEIERLQMELGAKNIDSDLQKKLNP